MRYCQEQFCFELPSVILARRRTKFEAKFFVTICQINISNILSCATFDSLSSLVS